MLGMQEVLNIKIHKTNRWQEMPVFNHKFIKIGEAIKMCSSIATEMDTIISNAPDFGDIRNAEDYINECFLKTLDNEKRQETDKKFLSLPDHIALDGAAAETYNQLKASYLNYKAHECK